MQELTAYCQQDVALTRDLFRFGQDKGHLLFKRKKDRAVLRVPVDWSWSALRRRFA
jgi:DEAD/DEAH box helicase domain-containing protein